MCSEFWPRRSPISFAWPVTCGVSQAQALAYGVKVSGCTVHFVDENLDAGPIIVQRAVEVRDDDSAETLSARILEQEHIAYVEALAKLQTRKWRIEGRRVIFE